MVFFGAWALAALTLMHGSLAQCCPNKLIVTNGGFESGKIAPWYTPAPQAGQPTTTIVSPGYKSKHALQLGVAESNFTDFSLIHPPIGEQCQGSYYRLNFALNWGTYSGPPSTASIGCKVFVQSSYCYGNVVGADQIYATPGAGWKAHSYTCMAEKTGEATYTMDFDCFGNATYQVPAFDFELDSFKITLLGASP